MIQRRPKWYPCAVCGDYTTNNQNGEAVGLCRPCEDADDYITTEAEELREALIEAQKGLE